MRDRTDHGGVKVWLHPFLRISEESELDTFVSSTPRLSKFAIPVRLHHKDQFNGTEVKEENETYRTRPLPPLLLHSSPTPSAPLPPSGTVSTPRSYSDSTLHPSGDLPFLSRRGRGGLERWRKRFDRSLRTLLERVRGVARDVPVTEADRTRWMIAFMEDGEQREQNGVEEKEELRFPFRRPSLEPPSTALWMIIIGSM